MKASYYNFFFPFNSDGDYLLYNALSNALVRIPKTNTTTVQEILTGDSLSHSDLTQMLLEQKYLVPDDIDELKEIQTAHLSAKYGNHTLFLTLVPTLNCNFNCQYCFEDCSLPTKKMNENIQNSVLKFAEASLKCHSEFKVTWYGGEPLLASDVIKSLSLKMIELCLKNNVNYSAGLITNGYLLDKKMLDNLKDCKIIKIQITIDGDDKAHDQRRPLKNGKGTYNKILSNLEALLKRSEKIRSVVVRINMDRENSKDVFKLTDELKKVDPENKISISLAKTNLDNRTCLTGNEFGDCVTNTQSYLINKKYSCQSIRIPDRLHASCAFTTQEGHIIGPKGEFYKCFEDVGRQDRIVGNINENNYRFGMGTNHRAYCYNYVAFDPTGHDQCSKCQYLPLCMGGCTKRRTENSGKPQCSPIKQTLKNTLINYVKLKQGD